MDNSLDLRTKTGIKCGLIGIVLNLLLFGGKIFAGLISSSVSITADAFNNLSDAASSIVTLVGFKLSSSRADAKHPYGHGRYEYVSAFIVAALIIVMGFELLRSSISKVITPIKVEYSLVIILILIASILVKLAMFTYNYIIGKRINSSVLHVTATDSLSDMFATTVVLIVTLIDHFCGLNLDGYCGILVALLVLWAGVSAGRDAMDPLLGKMPEKEFMEKIENTAVSFNENIKGVHDIMVHDYGPGRLIISLHVEVPDHGDILQLHDIIDNLEKKMAKDLKCVATIHMDPIATDDPLINETKEKVAEIVKNLYSGCRIHDFRMITGDTHTNLIFDAVLPYSCKKSDKEIREEIDKTIKEKLGESYYTVIDVDHSSFEENTVKN